MDNRFFENIIKSFVNTISSNRNTSDENSISHKVMKVICEEFRPAISNAVVLWRNQFNSDEKTIIADEFYPHPFNYKSYFKDEIVHAKECIYPLTGTKALVEYRDYFRSEISWWHQVWAFPIFDMNRSVIAFMVFLSSQSEVLLSKEQINLLQKIVNGAFISELSCQQNAMYDFVEKISDFTRIKRENKTLSNKYENLSLALEVYKSNIVHFSIWKIDDISKDDFNVIKDKSQNFKNVKQEQKQNYLLKSSGSHRVVSYINFLKQTGIVKELQKNDIIDISKFIKFETVTRQHINDGFCLTESYCREIGIEVNKTVILYIPIIPMRHNMKTDKTNILCLYINNIQNTTFRDVVIVSMLSRKIYESLTLHNQLITNDTTKKILEIQGKDEKEFYCEAASILRKRNECGGCYIYMKEKMENSFRLIIGINENDAIDGKCLEEKEITLPDSDTKMLLPLSSAFSKDSEFIQFISNSITKISTSEKYESYYLYYGKYPKDTNDIYSSILIPIKEKNTDRKDCFVGFVLFVNKNDYDGKSKVKYSPYFSAHNELIVSPSIESIYRYKLLREAIKKQELLLGRIRHEIPHEVNLVSQNAQILKRYFEEKINATSDSDEKSTYAHRMNEINQLLLSNERIGLYTSFATSINFTRSEILRSQEFLDFNVFLHSMEAIFKADAKERGVDVKFDDTDANYKCRVSKLYKLAIINIIFNAIRYSRFGNWITIYIGKGIIKVENYGIAIKKEEEKSIYQEGYRGKEAREFTEDGMGFGLFLAKKVIESHHNHYLTHTSEYISENNFAGIKAFYDFADERQNGLELFNTNYKNKFSWDDYFKKRSELEDRIPLGYNPRSISFSHIANFIMNEFRGASIPFAEFERLFFNVNVYKTTFEIKFFN